MTLMDAREYDFRRERRRTTSVICVLVAVVIALAAYFAYPYWQAHRMVNGFMTAVVDKNYMKAYAIWHPDPKAYPMDTFMQDWGPNGRWGVIESYRIDHVIPPPKMVGISGQSSRGSGMLAIVTVNGSSDQARLWVIKDHGQRVLAFYPY